MPQRWRFLRLLSHLPVLDGCIGSDRASQVALGNYAVAAELNPAFLLITMGPTYWWLFDVCLHNALVCISGMWWRLSASTEHTGVTIQDYLVSCFSWHEKGGLLSHFTTLSQIRVPMTCIWWWNCLEFPPFSYYFPQLLVPIMASISNPLSHTDAEVSKGTLKSGSLKWSRLKTFYEWRDCKFLFVLFQVGVFGGVFLVLVGVIFQLFLEVFCVCRGFILIQVTLLLLAQYFLCCVRTTKGPMNCVK